MHTRLALRSTALAAAALAFLAVPGAAAAAVDVFLKVGDIKGESQDDRHKDEIAVLSWSWGLAGAVPARHRFGQPACVQDLTVMKVVDRASVSLLSLSVAGDTVPSAKLTLRKAARELLEFLVIEMADVRVTSISFSGSSEVPTESVSLTFHAATVTYTPQKADGTAGTPVTTSLGGGCPPADRRDR